MFIKRKNTNVLKLSYRKNTWRKIIYYMFKIIKYFNFNISRYTFYLLSILKSHFIKKKSIDSKNIESFYMGNIHVHHSFSYGHLALCCQTPVLRRFIISMLLNDLQSHGQSSDTRNNNAWIHVMRSLHNV